MEEMKNKLFISVKLFFRRHLLISHPPPSPTSTSDTRRPVAADVQQHQPAADANDDVPNPTSTSDPETPVAADVQKHQPVADDGKDVPNPFGVVAAHNVVDWPAKVIGFCFSWAVAIALQSLQIHVPLPVSFHFLSHAIVIAVTLLYLSKYMYSNSPKLAQVLEHMGVLFGVAAFFFAITIPFPPCIKLVYWTIFAFSLLAIFLIKNLP